MDRREQAKQQARKGGAKAWAESQSRGFELTHIRLPEGRAQFKMEKSGFVRIDIIPYLVGQGNPSADPLTQHFERTIFVHNGLGLSGKEKYICIERTANKKCAVCDFIRNQGNSADPELIKKIRVQRRHLFNVIDIDNRAAGIRVYDAASGTPAHPDFGALLASKVMAIDLYENFSSLTRATGGFTLHCTVIANPPYGFKVTNIEMIPRVQDYKETIIAKAVCLDECPILLPYKEMHQKLFPGGTDDDTELTPSSNGVDSDMVGNDNDDDTVAPAAAEDIPAVDMDTIADEAVESDVVGDDDTVAPAADNDDGDVAPGGSDDLNEDVQAAPADDTTTADDDSDDSDDAPAAAPPAPAKKPAIASTKPATKPTAKPAAAPAKPAAAAKPIAPKQPESAGAIKIQSVVQHATHGRCEVVDIKGGKLTLEDKTGKEWPGIDPRYVTLPAATPKKK